LKLENFSPEILAEISAVCEIHSASNDLDMTKMRN